MPKYNVYPNPSGEGYLLDVQAEIHGNLNTRMVVPLLPLAIAPKPAHTLNPVFELNGEAHSMITQYMAAMPVKALRGNIFSIEEHRTEIVAAIDFLLQGF
ncbi:CcdB family protein [Propionivibrio limicola]|uniref:CcdB family protein n=1 Tax=Propionivibrio limicola TaxID=167645 RepID=UPI0012922ACF|nr:CcdB family protein [Propionivibrio limicola]